MVPTAAKNGATVIMSPGKSFDRQLALALHADASLTGLSLARRRVLVARSPTCHRHGHATITMSSGKPFDHRWWGAFGHRAFGRLAAKAYDVISSRASPPAHLAFLAIIHDPPALLDA